MSWDLNDFWYHTVSGYAMGGFAIAHVWLNRDRLVGYAQFRWRLIHGAPEKQRPTVARPIRASAPDAREPEPTRPLEWLGRMALSRRGLFGLAVGGLGGLVLGRGLRPAPPIEAGSDVGVIYHQWSKPGLIDALGTVGNWGQQPELYKTYPDVPVVALPEPVLSGGLPTEQAISSRRSTRDYGPAPMS